jgi:hypothetical protein
MGKKKGDYLCLGKARLTMQNNNKVRFPMISNALQPCTNLTVVYISGSEIHEIYEINVYPFINEQ